MKIKKIHFVDSYKLYNWKFSFRIFSIRSMYNWRYKSAKYVSKNLFELILLTSSKKKKKDSFVSILKKSHSVLIGRYFILCTCDTGRSFTDIRQKEDFQTSVFSFSFSFEMGLFVLVVIDYDERAMLTGNWLVYLVFRWWVHYDGYLHKYLWM